MILIVPLHPTIVFVLCGHSENTRCVFGVFKYVVFSRFDPIDYRPLAPRPPVEDQQSVCSISQFLFQFNYLGDMFRFSVRTRNTTNTFNLHNRAQVHVWFYFSPPPPAANFFSCSLCNCLHSLLCPSFQ